MIISKITQSNDLKNLVDGDIYKKNNIDPGSHIIYSVLADKNAIASHDGGESYFQNFVNNVKGLENINKAGILNHSDPQSPDVKYIYVEPSSISHDNITTNALNKLGDKHGFSVTEIQPLHIEKNQFHSPAGG